MALTPKQLCQRIEAAVTGAAPATGSWHLSAHAYPDFPPSLDSGDVAGLSFAVGAVRTDSDGEGRQRRSGPNARNGAMATTMVGVRFLYDVRADAKRDSYHEFLDQEVELVRFVLAVDTDPDLSIHYESSERIQEDAVLMGELSFVVRHLYPLTT